MLDIASAYGPIAVAADTDWLYFIDRETGTLERTSHTGTSRTTLRTGLSVQDFWMKKSLHVAGSKLYWAESDGVHRCQTDGTAHALVHPTSTTPTALAVDGNTLFVATGSLLVARNLTTQQVTPLCSASSEIRVMAFDAKSVYFGTDTALAKIAR